jgi:hypothetical protein
MPINTAFYSDNDIDSDSYEIIDHDESDEQEIKEEVENLFGDIQNTVIQNEQQEVEEIFNDIFNMVNQEQEDIIEDAELVFDNFNLLYNKSFWFGNFIIISTAFYFFYYKN